MRISEFEKNVINKKVAKVFEVRTSNTTHKVYQIYYKGKYILRTYCSFRQGDLYDHEIRGIKSQLKLDNQKQLMDLNNCPLSAEAYFKIIEGKKLL